jgi:glycosyltransferase involved in cell wall biosynthesis
VNAVAIPKKVGQFRKPAALAQLSVVIPVYNEAATIAEVVARVKEAARRQSIDAEIIAVDDGSTDDSLKRMHELEDVRILSLHCNSGKGAAVKAGMAAATKDIVIIQDADLEYDPDDYQKVIAPIVSGHADASLGSRFISTKLVFWGENKAPYFTHYIGNKLIIWATNVLYRNNGTDYEGCYKAFRRTVLRDLVVNSNGFEYDNELVCKLLKRGCSIAEVPIRYDPRSYESGKKINWKHGVRMLWTIVKYRFVD